MGAKGGSLAGLQTYHKQIDKDCKACKQMICLQAHGWHRYHMFPSWAK
jgi:hypothetical protein